MFGGLSKKSLKILDWREQQNLVPLPSYELSEKRQFCFNIAIVLFYD